MYELRSPAPALAPFLEHYWFVAPDAAPVDLRVDVFVDARADLVFNFGAPYVREVLGGPTTQHHLSNLDAQRLRPVRIVQQGLVRLTGVRFRLGGLGPFAREPLARWTDQTPSPDAVLGPEARGLEATLRESADLDAQVRALDAFFTARLETTSGYASFAKALAALEGTDGGAPIERVAAAAGVSARHLGRLFARYLGVAPKTVGRVLRFQRALRALMRDPKAALSRVAADAGYFDHAHFLRDFKRMTGGVPRGYRGYYPPEGPEDFAPNVVLFVQDAQGSSSHGQPRARAAHRRRARSEHAMTKHWSGAGTKADPWKLKTPPLSAEYTLYRDDAADPPLLVCQVGTTKLTYLARCVEDLHAMLVKHGDWMPLGAADEQKEAAAGTVEAWGRSKDNPVGGWYGQKKGLRGRFGLYVPPVLEALGLVELEHNARNNRVRAK